MRSLRPVIVELGLADEQELAAMDQAVRAHLADPHTVVVPFLWFTVWGRKPNKSPFQSGRSGEPSVGLQDRSQR